MREKFIIYQILTRAFGNSNLKCVSGGSLNVNGCGKFNDITPQRLQEIKKLQISYIWYTGIIEHSTKTDYSSYGIRKDNPQIVKGEAGSPYAIKDYYDVDPDLAVDIERRMDEFCALVDRTHHAGMKVMIDFVPNHLAREYFSDHLPIDCENFGENDTIALSFSKDNNFYYLINKKFNTSNIIHTQKQTYFESPVKVTGNDLFSDTPSSNDWYDTVKLNYGINPADGNKQFTPFPKTWEMMLDVLEFWASKGIDGFRCDMVGMVPVEFWAWAIEMMKERYPGIIFIGELYEKELYGSYINEGGFDYLYDKSGLYDCLNRLSLYYTAKRFKEAGEMPITNSITANWQSVDRIQNRLLNFLENHDEQRLASDFNLGNPFLALSELTVSLMLNRAPFLLYNGQEYGEKVKTSIFDYCSIPAIVNACNNNLNSYQIELYNIYLKLLFISINESAIRDGDLYDLQYANKTSSVESTCFNPNSMYTFIRRTRKTFNDSAPKIEMILCTVDFTQQSSRVKIMLPDDLFKSWNIAPGSCFDEIDLVGNVEEKKTILGEKCLVETIINKYGFSIIKFSLEREPAK